MSRGDLEHWRETLKNLPRAAGTPGEIADIVVFLASERASYMVGSVVDIRGGGAYR